MVKNRCDKRRCAWKDSATIAVLQVSTKFLRVSALLLQMIDVPKNWFLKMVTGSPGLEFTWLADDLYCANKTVYKKGCESAERNDFQEWLSEYPIRQIRGCVLFLWRFLTRIVCLPRSASKRPRRSAEIRCRQSTAFRLHAEQGDSLRKSAPPVSSVFVYHNPIFCLLQTSFFVTAVFA